MATGNEVWLAIIGHKKISKALNDMGCAGELKAGLNFNLDDYERNEETISLFESHLEKHACNSQIMNAGLEILKEKFGSFKLLENDYVLCDTPMGERQFSKFALNFHMDSNDMDESVEEAILGVRLSSRYSPTFLDWKNDGTLHPVVFDKELLADLELAKKHLMPILRSLSSEFEDACIIVKEMFY